METETLEGAAQQAPAEQCPSKLHSVWLAASAFLAGCGGGGGGGDPVAGAAAAGGAAAVAAGISNPATIAADGAIAAAAATGAAESGGLYLDPTVVASVVPVAPTGSGIVLTGGGAGPYDASHFLPSGSTATSGAGGAATGAGSSTAPAAGATVPGSATAPATGGSTAPAAGSTTAPAAGSTTAPAGGSTTAPAGGTSGATTGSTGSTPPKVTSPNLPASQPVASTAVTDESAARFLLQAQFSASTSEIAAVRSLGYAGWLSQQMAATSQTGWDWLDSKGYNNPFAPNAYYYDRDTQTDYMLWKQLFGSPDSVRKRVTLALSEFFVVSLTEVPWRSHAMAAWWDLLAQHAFGNFRNLIEAVTLNPAMGFWLNTRQNTKEDPVTGRQPDENYAREIMQLMTIGLTELNADGTERKDAQGRRIDSYTQADVTNLSRVFTGYDLNLTTGQMTNLGGRSVYHIEAARRPMVLADYVHSNLAVNFLGTTIGAGTPGAQALRTALDTLFRHPNVGPFFGKQMIQRLVTSNPSPAYVARVAARFNNNGSGVRGDLSAVFAAILLDEEARGAQGLSQAGYGKLREPIVRLVQWGRTFGLTSASGDWKIGDLSNPGNSIGQSPLRSPSVFNFFRPGYMPPNTAIARSGAVAPEFQIVTETSVSGYINFMQNVIRNGFNADVQPAYAEELPLAGNPVALVKRLNLLLCAGQLSPNTQALIANALAATPITASSSAAARRDAVAAAVLLVMCCPEYLVQK